AKVVLEAAINGLVEKATEVNKSELQEVYDDNKEKIKGNYTDDSWKAFTGALKNAEEILAKVDATQEEVDTAKGALEDAIKNLKEKSDEINTDKLEEKISKVEGLNKSDYTEESWSVLKKALSAAKELLNNSNITQEAIDKAYEDLAKAEDGLKKKDSNIIPDSDTETGNKDNDELSQGDLPQTGGVNSSIWLALSGLLIVLGVIFLKKNNRIKA
ncbi:MAG: LPXTG cell wall anchor domain-containing protein, partial [Clostridium sp.]|uniref:LPXTG cell wall anchor domain-containing protein n=1 Tax=Clostridium sp. TaxID=1506 RepID=UPI0029150559